MSAQAIDRQRAAGVDTTAVRNWVARGHILMPEGDREAAGSGNARLFSLRRALQIAVAAELVRLHVPPSAAAHYALEFTDMGGTEAAFREGETPPIRNPGDLFPDGRTFLIVYPSGRAGVINVLNDPSFLEAVEKARLSKRGDESEAFTAVDLGAVTLRVRAFLDLPRE